jgi:hypothetical protein
MRDYSHQSINLQFIQFVPELNFLQVSVYRDGHPAYYNDPVVFDLNELFADPSVSVPENSSGNKMAVCPNPASGFFRVAGTFPGVYRVEIADINGRTRIDNEFRLPDDLIRIDELPAGIYSLRATGTKGVYTGKVLKSH